MDRDYNVFIFFTLAFLFAVDIYLIILLRDTQAVLERTQAVTQEVLLVKETALIVPIACGIVIGVGVCLLLVGRIMLNLA